MSVTVTAIAATVGGLARAAVDELRDPNRREKKLDGRDMRRCSVSCRV